MAELLADDFCSDDRRRVVERGNPARSGRRHRGHANNRRPLDHERHVDRHCDPRGTPCPHAYPFLGHRRPRPGAFLTEVLGLVEIDTDERIVAIVLFDLDDFDAAVVELDARYLAGEAAAHSRTWSVIMQKSTLGSTGTKFPRRHRTGFTLTIGRSQRSRPMICPHPSAPSGTSRRTSTTYIEAVHRLSDLGAVITHMAHGISHEGFDAEWRLIYLHVRGRIGQPLRDVRRGRHRRRTCSVRRTAPAGAAAGKRSKPR